MRTLALLAFLLPVAAAAQEEVFPGVVYSTSQGNGQRVYVVTVDLCRAGISVRGTRPAERGATVPDWASRVGVQVAVNGNFFGPGFENIDGWAAGDGERWGGADHSDVAPVAFGPGRVDIWPHEEEQGQFWGDWMQQIVSGHPTLIADGQRRDNSGDVGLCPRNPRTALGFSQDWHTLILAVVDGREGAAQGMTCNELADVMAFVGAWNAVNLDGGGSSTLWIQGRGVVNHPSDGHPRTVSTHLGVFARGAGPAAHCMQPQAPCDAQPDWRGCDGNFIANCHHTQVDRGDCSFFGLTCGQAGGPPRCVDPRCVDGNSSRCVSPTVIGTCMNDVYSEGNCGMFGAGCAEDAQGPFCVHPFCGQPERVYCADDHVLRTCTRGQLQETDCAMSGQVCSGMACVDPGAVVPDAAPVRDAAPVDATVLPRDAASRDAAPVPDAARRDAAPSGDAAPLPDAAAPDGGRRRAGEVRDDGGCAGGSPLFLLALLRRRRACGAPPSRA